MKNFYNPFTECTARDITFEEVEKYWCSPYGAFEKIDENVLINCPTPVIIEGPRGSGKTMLLKHLSYFCQKLLITSNMSLIDYFASIGSIGVYFRYKDDFGSLFEYLNCEDIVKSKVFNYYFNLYITQELLTIVEDLSNDNQISLEKNKEFFTGISNILSESIVDFNDIEISLNKKIDKIDAWVKNSRYIENSAEIIRTIIVDDNLIEQMCNLVRSVIPKWNNILFSIIVDEYENASKYQRELNTLIKQVDQKNRLTYRIGVRPSGIITNQTNVGEEFIQEGRDYLLCSLTTPKGSSQMKKYKDFIKNVANKRLKLVPILNDNGLTDIEKLLGAKEDLEKEARDIVKNRTVHFDKIKNTLTLNEYSKVYDLLKNNDNPLLEMLNILWFYRGKSPIDINSAMNSYLNKNCDDKKSDGYKYNMDYVNKYKYTLLFILIGIYGSRKSYYSFNTFAYLSSGAINDFISICRNVFYRLDEELIVAMNESGEARISEKIQTQAAYETALEQINKVKLCKNFGKKMYCFTMNMGNLFRKYHRDPLARYPETNQFAFADTSSIESTPESNKILNGLLMWGVVLRKKNIQSLSIGLRKGEIFYFNKIFSPLFDISYRIRGGYNPVLSTEAFIKLSTSDLEVSAIEELIKINNFDDSNGEQISLF